MIIFKAADNNNFTFLKMGENRNMVLFAPHVIAICHSHFSALARTRHHSHNICYEVFMAPFQIVPFDFIATCCPEQHARTEPSRCVCVCPMWCGANTDAVVVVVATVIVVSDETKEILLGSVHVFCEK